MFCQGRCVDNIGRDLYKHVWNVHKNIDYSCDESCQQNILNSVLHDINKEQLREGQLSTKPGLITDITQKNIHLFEIKNMSNAKCKEHLSSEFGIDDYVTLRVRRDQSIVEDQSELDVDKTFYKGFVQGGMGCAIHIKANDEYEGLWIEPLADCIEINTDKDCKGHQDNLENCQWSSDKKQCFMKYTKAYTDYECPRRTIQKNACSSFSNESGCHKGYTSTTNGKKVCVWNHSDNSCSQASDWCPPI